MNDARGCAADPGAIAAEEARTTRSARAGRGPLPLKVKKAAARNSMRGCGQTRRRRARHRLVSEGQCCQLAEWLIKHGAENRDGRRARLTSSPRRTRCGEAREAARLTNPRRRFAAAPFRSEARAAFSARASRSSSSSVSSFSLASSRADFGPGRAGLVGKLARTAAKVAFPSPR